MKGQQTTLTLLSTRLMLLASLPSVALSLVALSSVVLSSEVAAQPLTTGNQIERGADPAAGERARDKAADVISAARSNAPLPPYRGARIAEAGGERPVDRQGKRSGDVPLVNWVGLEKGPSAGQGRVFLSFDRACAATVGAISSTELVVDVPNALVAHRNTMRPLDASALGTPVSRVIVEAHRNRKSPGVRVRILLNETATHAVTTTETGVVIDISRQVR